jgi:hypothetical protein
MGGRLCELVFVLVLPSRKCPGSTKSEPISDWCAQVLHLNAATAKVKLQSITLQLDRIAPPGCTLSGMQLVQQYAPSYPRVRVVLWDVCAFARLGLGITLVCDTSSAGLSDPEGSHSTTGNAVYVPEG